MTTTMSAPPISGSELRAREEAMARAAGWRPAELRWERMQEEALQAWRAGDQSRAIGLWNTARRLAFWRLPLHDPRRATSLANAGMAARLGGDEAHARRLYRRALRRWRRVSGRIAWQEPGRRARSSLFHLRMEARHRDTYVANWRQRMAGFVAEAAAALADLAEGRPPSCRLFERWRGEKPPVFDDGRRLLGAVLLIASPPPG